jgi:hypothetical protein
MGHLDSRPRRALPKDERQSGLAAKRQPALSLVL